MTADPAAGLDAGFSAVRGRFRLTVDLRVGATEVLAVIGPNGAGKSTVVAALAGLLPIAAGQIRIGDRVVSAPGRTVPPQQRRVGLLGQQPMLFPHLSALQNVAFGPRAGGTPRAAAAQQARDLLARMGLADLADRRPSELSGGQQQRVALARALAIRPSLLVLDEPLSALDAEAVPTVRHRLAMATRGVLTTVLVSHDVVDIALLADRALVLDAGAVVATGSPAELLAQPPNAFVAALAGVNLVTGQLRDGRLQTADGRDIAGLAVGPRTDGPAAAVFAPSAVAVYPTRPDGSPRNCWPSTVQSVEPGPGGAGTIRVRLAGAPQLLADLTPAAVAELGLHPGLAVWVAIKATEVRLHAR